MNRFLPLLCGAALLLTGACNSKQYEQLEDGNLFGSWGVTDKTHAFGGDNGRYYLINPAGNVTDTVYYNGNYSDSYYHIDSTRVTLKYTTSDSIIFRLDRMYAVQKNPHRLIMDCQALGDTSMAQCRLLLEKDKDNDVIFRTGPNAKFREMLSREMTVYVRATNGPSTSEPEGSQNYQFTIYTDGFNDAMARADSLNGDFKVNRNSLRDSTLNHKEKEREDKDIRIHEKDTHKKETHTKETKETLHKH